MCSFAGGGPSRDRGPSPSFSSAAPRCRDRRRPPAATRAAEAARPTPATVHPGAPHTSTVRSASDGSLLATEHSSAAREVSLSHGASAGRRISSRRRAGAWRSAARSACPGCLPGMQRVTVCLRVELPPPFGDNSLRMAAGSRRAPGGTHHGIAQVEGQGNQPGRRADSVRVDLDHSVCCPDVETADRDGWRQEQRRHLPPGQDRGGIEHDRTRSEAACTRRTYQTCRAVSHSTTPGAQFVEPSAPAKVEAQDGQTREQRRVAHGLRQAGGATRLSSVGIGFSVSRQPPLDNSAGGRRPRRSGRRSSGSPDPAPPIVRPPGRRHTRKIAATGGVRYKRRRPRGNWTGSGTPHAVVAAPCIARVRRSPSRGARTAGRRSPTTGRPAARAAPRRSSPGEWRGRGPRNTGPNCQFATTVAWPRRKAGE